MPALPRLNLVQSAKCPYRVNKVQSLRLGISVLLFVLVSLFTIHYSLFTSEAYAASGDPPNPQPCQNALETDNLTDHYITNPRGDAPFDQVVNREGTLNQQFDITVSGTFSVDFSKLQSLFAAPNYKYLEGDLASDSHRQNSIIDLNLQDLNSFHGPVQKAITTKMVDEYKRKYVKTIWEKPELPESTLTYTDIEGLGGPKTIHDLVIEFGGIPTLPQTDEEEQWQSTWGKYWEKIPTSWDEFYKGKIQYRLAKGQKQFQNIKKGEDCPLSVTEIEFVLPQFFKTTSVADELNQVIVPVRAQSYQDHETIQASKPSTGLFANIKNFCKELFDKPVETAKNIFRISLKKLNPVKTANAQSPPPCVVPIASGPKQGSAPFCALPADQASKALSCSNNDDPNKLDKNNPRVVCTFAFNTTFTFTVRPTVINPAERADDDFDSCSDPEGDGTFACNVEIRGWPVLMIPYIAEIYNSTYDSQEEEGIVSPQETGRPGIYKFFIPNTIKFTKNQNLESLLKIRQDCLNNPTAPECQDLFAIWQQLGCSAEQPEDEFLKCLGYSPSIPGQVINSNPDGIKEKFIGSTDCAKQFARDFSLKPKALQEYFGISSDCEINQ